jgi:hypothetical protein
MKFYIYEKSLGLLDDVVHIMSGKSVKDYGLPVPLRSVENTINQEYMLYKAYDIKEVSNTVMQNEPLLNEDQKRVYDEVMQSIQSENGYLFF